MSIRIPLTGVLDYNDVGNVGAGSVAGGVALPFQLPQDVDNVVVKLTASIVGGGVSATFQTSDDGGTTYYDVARTSVVSNANTTTAQWLSIPVISGGVNPQVLSTINPGSVLGGTVGSAAASTLGSRQVSGLPVLGIQNRVFLQYSAGVSANALARVTVSANQQSASA